MAHVQVCPVCGGRGKRPPIGLCGSGTAEETCHGCWGRGWVNVKDPPAVGVEKKIIQGLEEFADALESGEDITKKFRCRTIPGVRRHET